MTEFKNCKYPLNILADVDLINLRGKCFTRKSMEYGIQKHIEEELVQIAELYYRDKKNLEEIAEIVNISYNCAKDRLAKLQSHVGQRIRYFESYTYENIEESQKTIAKLEEERNVLYQTINNIYALASKKTTVKFNCKLKKLNATGDCLGFYKIKYPDGRTIEGSKKLESFEHEYVSEIFEKDLDRIASLPELDKDKHGSILYDLVEEIWSSPYNYAYFDTDYLESHYDYGDLDDFFENDVVQQYISKGLIEIYGEPDDEDFSIEANGELGEAFVRITME